MADSKKQFNQIPDKTSLDDSDRFLLSTASGARRITRDNFAQWLFRCSSPYSSIYNKWIRIAKVTATAGQPFSWGLFVISYGLWNTQRVIPSALLISENGHQDSALVSLDAICLSSPIGFSQVRLTKENGVRYIEVFCNINTSYCIASLSNRVNMELLKEAVIMDGTPSGVTVLSTVNLSYNTNVNSLNNTNMQQADLQAKMGGVI